MPPKKQRLAEHNEVTNNNDLLKLFRERVNTRWRPIPMPTFSGTPAECPHKFIHELEDYLQYIDAVDYVNVVNTCLEGKAKIWWSMYQFMIPEWDSFQELLVNRFGRPRTPTPEPPKPTTKPAQPTPAHPIKRPKPPAEQEVLVRYTTPVFSKKTHLPWEREIALAEHRCLASSPTDRQLAKLTTLQFVLPPKQPDAVIVLESPTTQTSRISPTAILPQAQQAVLAKHFARTPPHTRHDKPLQPLPTQTVCLLAQPPAAGTGSTPEPPKPQRSPPPKRFLRSPPPASKKKSVQSLLTQAVLLPVPPPAVQSASTPVPRRPPPGLPPRPPPGLHLPTTPPSATENKPVQLPAQPVLPPVLPPTVETALQTQSPVVNRLHTPPDPNPPDGRTLSVAKDQQLPSHKPPTPLLHHLPTTPPPTTEKKPVQPLPKQPGLPPVLPPVAVKTASPVQVPAASKIHVPTCPSPPQAANDSLSDTRVPPEQPPTQCKLLGIPFASNLSKQKSPPSTTPALKEAQASLPRPQQPVTQPASSMPLPHTTPVSTAHLPKPFLQDHKLPVPLEPPAPIRHCIFSVNLPPPTRKSELPRSEIMLAKETTSPRIPSLATFPPTKRRGPHWPLLKPPPCHYPVLIETIMYVT